MAHPELRTELAVVPGAGRCAGAGRARRLHRAGSLADAAAVSALCGRLSSAAAAEWLADNASGAGDGHCAGASQRDRPHGRRPLMAAAPPPFTSGPSGPGNPDPRWQWKQQRRAAKDQWRAQRAYYRGMRRPSIVRPVVLIAIGVVALMIEAGTISGYEFWDWYVRWWPLLLIGLGLALLGEWYMQQGDPYGRRACARGVVSLSVSLAVLGGGRAT